MPAKHSRLLFLYGCTQQLAIMNTNINKAKTIAFIVHPAKKAELIEWSYFNRELLQQHEIIATGDAANILQGTLNKPVTTYLMGPYEGYTELNSLINNGTIDAVIVLWSTDDETPLQRNGLRSVIHAALEADIIIASNKTTANFIITSPLMREEMEYETAAYEVKKYNAA